MKKLVRCACVLLVLSSIFSACAKDEIVLNEILENESQNSNETINERIDDNNFERYDLLMTKYINDTKIYGISVFNGIYDKVQIQINDNKKEFNWRSLGDDDYLPRINYGDINNDEINECIIVMLDDEGDNNIVQKIHVLNPETLDEIEIEDANEFIAKNLKSINENGLVNVLLDNVVIYSYDLNQITFTDNIDNNINEKSDIHELNCNDVDFNNILDYINYSDVIYKINGNNISANITFYLNDIKINDVEIDYCCEEEKMICKIK